MHIAVLSEGAPFGCRSYYGTSYLGVLKRHPNLGSFAFVHSRWELQNLLLQWWVVKVLQNPTTL